MFMIISPDDIQVYELNTGLLKVKTPIIYIFKLNI
jgi:hypothetical protein